MLDLIRRKINFIEMKYLEISQTRILGCYCSPHSSSCGALWGTFGLQVQEFRYCRPYLRPPGRSRRWTAIPQPCQWSSSPLPWCVGMGRGADKVREAVSEKCCTVFHQKLRFEPNLCQIFTIQFSYALTSKLLNWLWSVTPFKKNRKPWYFTSGLSFWKGPQKEVAILILI